MKTKLFFTSLFLTVFVLTGSAQNAAAFTAQKCSADVQLTAENQIVVRYLNVNDKNIKVFIYNEQGERLFAKRFRTAGHMKLTYQVKDLPKGNITFKVLCNNKLACIETLRVSESGIASIPQPIPFSPDDLSGNPQILVSQNQ